MTPQDIINKGLKLLERKNADYAAKHNRHENFEHSAMVMEWFKKDIDKVYIALITTKITRLATLLNSEMEPNNESIEDSFVDLVNYCALWGSKRISPAAQEMTPESRRFHEQITNSVDRKEWDSDRDRAAKGLI